MAAERAVSAYRFGRFVLSVAEHVLRQGNERISLTPKEFDTLHILVARAGHVVSKEELLRAVWPDAYVSDSNLTRNVSVLRKHLGAEAIKTIPKRGYCFALAVEPEGMASLESSTSASRVAVLPFANLSGDARLDGWVDTVCEETIEALVRCLEGRLPVVSLATLARYQQTEKSAQEMAEDLRVEYLLTGWMRKDSGAFRFHIEIVNARSFTFVWVGSINVQDEQEARPASQVGARIAQAARAALLPGAVASSDERFSTGATQD